MLRTAVVIDERYEEHQTGYGHPERAERVAVLRDLLVSAGFDAHLRDPLASMRVSEEGFGCLARVLLRIAAEHAGGRFAAVLEGGY